jgi:CRISPR-associated protein Csm3
MNKLTNKITIKGFIICETGLRIGGNKSSLEIGGLDLNVIKSAAGEPFLPGSSLKGKLRTLLSKVRGWERAEQDEEPIKSLFGGGGGKEVGIITRLFVRDAMIDKNSFKNSFPDKSKRDFEFTEVKTENVINRSNGKAEHPRSIERVPAGTVFNFSMLLDIYEGDNIKQYFDCLNEAFELLMMDYLGGHGSRGSGLVKIEITEIKGKVIAPGNFTDMTGEVWKTFLENFSTPTTTLQ